MKSGDRRFEFGPFVLVPHEHLLLRAGAPIRLARKDFDILVALVEREGGLVRKEDLLQLIWPNTFVEEGTLTKHVSTLRKALDDGDAGGRLIETVPRVGFRFVAPVRRQEGEPGGAAVVLAPPAVPLSEIPAANTSRWQWAFGGTLAVIALATAVVSLLPRPAAPVAHEWRALAVLPFETLDVSDEIQPLGLGLADGIITRLSGQRVLRVRPTSAVRGYTGAARPDVETIGHALDANVLLEGHIRRVGETVRVTVQLTEVDGRAPVWGGTFDQPVAEFFKLEDAIADRVAGALRLQLAAAEQERLRRRYTENAPAYEAYLAGRESLLRYTPAGATSAIAHFERALALDPRYVLARAGLAMASAEMCLRYARSAEVEQWGERAEREAAEALAIDPDLAEAHLARAAVFRKREFNWDEALAASRRATTLNPNLDQPHLFAAAAYYHVGLMDQSAVELERGKAVRGGDMVEPVRIESLIALFSGRFDAARERLEALSRQSNRAIGDTYLALSYYYTGDTGRARQMLENLSGDSSASTASRAGAALASILAAAGEPDRARSALNRVLSHEYRDHHVAYNLGTAFGQLGDKAEALRWLQASADTGFPCPIFYTRDPLLAPLRGEPAFRAFVSDLEQRRDAAALRHPLH